jgi:chitin disaccharide deacetylase
MRIVLHADDFGASPDTVRATIECFERGALTSASIMPAMPATSEAIAYARQHPELDIGVHLTFVGDGEERPLSSYDEIPGLLDGEGRFLATRTVRLRALAHRLPVDQIEREVVAQVEAVRAEGVAISHVDSHRHLHKLPSFRAALVRALPRLDIHRVRAVQDVYLRRPLRSPTFWLGRRWQRSLARAFTTTDHMYMPTSAGDRGWEDPLAGIVRDLDGETIEIGVHPGYDDWRAEERTSVLAFADRARADGHELVSWREIP